MRRSERSRRVATRAWCTPSGSTSSRMTASCRMSRITDSASARCTASPALASAPRSLTAISGVSGSSAQRPDVLRRLVRRAGARLAEPLDEGVQEARRHLVADLHLDLAKRRPAPAVLTETASSTTPARSLPSTSWIRPAPDRRHPDALVQFLAADEPADERDTPRPGACSVPLEDDLGADEIRRVPLCGQLHRPALAGPVAEACAPPREAKIVRVVVRRVVPLGGRLPHRRADEPVDARHTEVGRRGELQLAFGTVLHGRLSVPPSISFARVSEPQEAAPARRSRPQHHRAPEHAVVAEPRDVHERIRVPVDRSRRAERVPNQANG